MFRQVLPGESGATAQTFAIRSLGVAFDFHFRALFVVLSKGAPLQFWKTEVTALDNAPRADLLVLSQLPPFDKRTALVLALDSLEAAAA